jgi:hypothetical protein
MKLARSYVQAHVPELADVPLHLRQLDGPPGSPRFLVTIERCGAAECPHGVPQEIAETGGCSVHECSLRHAVQLLLGREGELIRLEHNGVHWP